MSNVSIDCIVCSSNTVTLFEYKDKQIRYCDNCFHLMNSCGGNGYLDMESSISFTLDHSFLTHRPGEKLLVTGGNNCITQCPSDFKTIKYTQLISDTNDNGLCRTYDIIVVPFVFNQILTPNLLIQIMMRYMSETSEIYVYLKHFTSPEERIVGVLNNATCSDFSTNSLKRLCNQNSLELDSLSFRDSFQNYTIFRIAKTLSDGSNVVSQLVDELETNMYNLQSYNNWRYQTTIFRNLLENIILQFRCQDYIIVDCCSDRWVDLFGLNQLVYTGSTLSHIQTDTRLLLIYNNSNALDVWHKLGGILSTHTGSLELLNTSTLGLYCIY